MSSAFAHALELGATPAVLIFEENNVCKNITLFSDRNGVVLSGKTLWSFEESKQLENYKLSPQLAGIEIRYPQSIELEQGKENIQVCIMKDSKQKAYGVLVYQSENGHVGIGVWLVSEGEQGEKKGSELVTGKIIDIHSASPSGLFLAILLFVLLLLLCILFLCLHFEERKRKHLV